MREFMEVLMKKLMEYFSKFGQLEIRENLRGFLV
jgi:hypothetical protein